jgi:hypothetical protein
MNTRLVGAMTVMIAAALFAAGCTGPSCLGAVQTTTESAASSTTTTTLLPATSSTFSTTNTSLTTTTFSPLEAYRAAMRTWADTYGPGLQKAYTVISGANFTKPTPEQVQAAQDLDALMGPMIKDLAAIQPPPELSAAHAGFLGSLTKMAGGAHDLAQKLQNGQGLLALVSVATIAAAWQEGASARATLEQALGFSLSG